MMNNIVSIIIIESNVNYSIFTEIVITNYHTVQHKLFHYVL